MFEAKFRLSFEANVSSKCLLYICATCLCSRLLQHICATYRCCIFVQQIAAVNCCSIMISKQMLWIRGKRRNFKATVMISKQHLSKFHRGKYRTYINEKLLWKVNCKIVHTNLFRSIALERHFVFLKRKMTKSTTTN